MVAQIAASSQSFQQRNTSDELTRLQDYCRHLNQSLEAERAKSSKLRQYIARLNNTRTPLQAAPQNQASLQALVEDQTRLIEQLYAENEQHREQVADLERKNQQLMTANNKLKARNIDLRRRLRITGEPETVETVTTPAAVVAADNDLSTEAAKSRSQFWLRLPLPKNA